MLRLHPMYTLFILEVLSCSESRCWAFCKRSYLVAHGKHLRLALDRCEGHAVVCVRHRSRCYPVNACSPHNAEHKFAPCKTSQFHRRILLCQGELPLCSIGLVLVRATLHTALGECTAWRRPARKFSCFLFGYSLADHVATCSHSRKNVSVLNISVPTMGTIFFLLENEYKSACQIKCWRQNTTHIFDFFFL